MLTSDFVLVLCVAACVVAVWITLRAQAQLTLHESALRTIADRLDKQSLMLNGLQNAQTISSPAALTARIDDLAAAVASNAATVRRELGKLWGRVSANGRVTSATDDVDDELQAILSHQSAPATAPK
jgi:predicted hydrocarbon binding protein